MKLATYITQDMRRRIQSGRNLPGDLTLTGLSTHYNVSLTPVRTAVKELVAEGFLCKQATGRLAVNPRKLGTAPSTKPPAAPRTPADWDRILIREVMLASLEQDRVYLREEALAEKYEIGRSVIRQGLSRLAGAGLIDHVARCGWLVHPVSEQDVHSYLEVRELLELKALDLARPGLARDALQRMLERNPVARPSQPPCLDNRLHQYFIEKSGNRYIRAFFQQPVARYYTALFDYAAPRASVVAEMAGQHRRILEALISQHWRRARAALSEHIWSQERVLRKLLKR